MVFNNLILTFISTAILICKTASEFPDTPYRPYQFYQPEDEVQSEKHNNYYQYPTCIIGAGISGLNIGTLLTQKGYHVHIFEKEPIVGGKVRTYRVPNQIQVEMCPLIFTQNDKFFLDKIKQYNLTPTPFDNRDQLEFDPSSGQIFPPGGNLTEAQQQAILLLLKEASKRYISHRNMYKNDLKFGYLNISPDLFVPIAEWLELRNLAILKPVLSIVITVEGYGALEDVPALYVLKLVDDFIIQALTSNQPGSFMTLKEGLDTLVHLMARSLPVSLSTEVTFIRRKNNYQVIKFRNGRVALCNNAILAFPPLLPKLERIIPNLNLKERNILGNVKIHKYVTSASFIPGLNHTILYAAKGLRGNGEVVAFIKQSSLIQQNIFSSYSWIRGDFRNLATVNERNDMNRQLKETLGKISTSSDFETFATLCSEYFPHVASTGLKQGFYKEFDSIQGNGGIYYATTLLGFENMNGALEMSQGFVERYF